MFTLNLFARSFFDDNGLAFLCFLDYFVLLSRKEVAAILIGIINELSRHYNAIPVKKIDVSLKFNTGNLPVV